jgi:hypothetical protein
LIKDSSYSEMEDQDKKAMLEEAMEYASQDANAQLDMLRYDLGYKPAASKAWEYILTQQVAKRAEKPGGTPITAGSN